VERAVGSGADSERGWGHPSVWETSERTSSTGDGLRFGDEAPAAAGRSAGGSIRCQRYSAQRAAS
jgi:hypothetical protein